MHRYDNKEAVGFEPTVPHGTLVFKTSSLNRSDTPPALQPLPVQHYKLLPFATSRQEPAELSTVGDLLSGGQNLLRIRRAPGLL